MGKMSNNNNNNQQSFIETLPAYCLYLTASSLPLLFAKSVTAPLERVQLLLQSQDVHQVIRKQEVPRFTSLTSSLRRLVQEEGILSLWNGNTARLLQHVAAEVFLLEFRDKIKTWTPKVELEDAKQSRLVNNTITNTLAASASILFTFPLDFARVRLAGSFRQPTQSRPWMGTADAWMQTAKGSSNPLSIYRGIVPAVMHKIYYRTAYLTFVDMAMKANPFRKEAGWLGTVSQFAVIQSGVLAAVFCAYPLETVKVRMMMEADIPANSRLYRHSLHAVVSIFKEENISGFYKGFGVAALKSVSTALAVSAFYEIKKVYDQVLLD